VVEHYEFNNYGGASDPAGATNFIQPKLFANNQLQIAWTNIMASVYFASNLKLPVVWVLVTNSPILSNNQIILAVPTDQRQGVYRLQ